MLQLYYTVGSPPSRAVLHVIRILGLEVDVKNVDLVEKKEQLSAEYLKINPMHQVPVLVDGNVVVAESRAIMAYLVNSRKPGHELYPTDPKVRALIDQRLYFDCVNFFELAASIVVSTKYRKYYENLLNFCLLSVQSSSLVIRISTPIKLQNSRQL